MEDVPERIHLVVDPEDECPDSFNYLSGVTWAYDRINDSDIEYVRFSEIIDCHGEPINLNDTLRIEVRSYKDQKPISTFIADVEIAYGQFCVKTPTGEYQWIGGFGRHCSLEVINE